MSYLTIKKLTKKYGDFTAVEDIDLDIGKGEMIALLGGSGCGKTTILRMIAGFIEPTSGSVILAEKSMDGLPSYKRNVGILFQNYALFPHMTVFENVAFSLKLKKMKKQVIKEKVLEALAMVRLEGKEGRYPRQLSGGQQQRVALARALVMEPDLLLLDEPLSNLDAKLRHEMQIEIKRIQKEMGLTTIIVTHDQEEAVSLADRVVIMNSGHVLQKGNPKEVFNHPATAFVADFMGFSNFFEGMVEDKVGQELKIRLGKDIVQSCSIDKEANWSIGDEVELSIRPEHVLLSKQKKDNSMQGTVSNMTYKGQHTVLSIESQVSQEVQANIQESDLPEEGDKVYFYFPSDKVILYKKNE